MAFIFTDSLGSTVVTRYQLGNVYRNGYYPIGEERYSTSSTPYLFTGQRNESVIGLYDYLARFYGLSSMALGEEEYYCFVSDILRDWCIQTGVLPCILDAAIFSSYDTDEWPEDASVW